MIQRNKNTQNTNATNTNKQDEDDEAKRTTEAKTTSTPSIQSTIDTKYSTQMRITVPKWKTLGIKIMEMPEKQRRMQLMDLIQNNTPMT